jgi:hypothetical protein
MHGDYLVLLFIAEWHPLFLICMTFFSTIPAAIAIYWRRMFSIALCPAQFVAETWKETLNEKHFDAVLGAVAKS